MLCSSLSSDAALAMSRTTSVHCFGFAKRATFAKFHLIVTALLQLLLLEPTHAIGKEPDECGLCIGLFKLERRDGER
jgi:hypothetical protein